MLLGPFLNSPCLTALLCLASLLMPFPIAPGPLHYVCFRSQNNYRHGTSVIAYGFVLVVTAFLCHSSSPLLLHYESLLKGAFNVVMLILTSWSIFCILRSLLERKVLGFFFFILSSSSSSLLFCFCFIESKAW